MGNRIKMTVALGPILVFTLAGCGGEDAPPPQSSDQVITPSAPAPPPATPSAGAADLPAGVTADMVAQGETIFHGQGICFTCHGQQGTGGPLAPSLNDQEWINIETGNFEEIVSLIQTGVPQPVEFQAPMPPNGGAALNDEQRRQVAAYVYSLSRGG